MSIEGQIRLDNVRRISGQVRKRHVKVLSDLGLIRSRHVSSVQLNVRSGQCRSGQVITGQVISG